MDSLISRTSDSKRGRARIVFDVFAERENAEYIHEEGFKKLLCASGVSAEDAVQQFAGLCSVDGDGLTFEVFVGEMDSVWEWYYDYMKKRDLH